MTQKTAVRPGGRSARIQQAVHQAVHELERELPRDALTLPRIAERAGVTPSTLYRRWGNLAELLADVNLERLRPETPPADTGTLAGDLLAWSEQYHDELTSRPGQRMLRDVLASDDAERRRCCSDLNRQQMQTIVQRAGQRGETVPSVETLMERLVAPLVYYLLYDAEAVDHARLERWVGEVVGSRGE
ncbi:MULTISPECIES: TetR/AcrR family transcriptional regulator [unclassified Modicisalibacter]|uniref:TetR/AcrR family transcriptional regulator n=1 Tax=unclassified Modicisalibacter TaxID=2679913 RepID=UPI001CCB5ABD|nr:MULTISPECIES: TetR/AcrR family transcriptional regulator [unclassified Modicisalibacter]MBZ9558780.1 TetR/AcrR family transcriptional regulator [Modicisalibacter sp. R2A 31.J]MBZ9575329.1 TetR/AcrR family transcriptional regulator [Modicisalibacter sp. MOD 31.J]